MIHHNRLRVKLNTERIKNIMARPKSDNDEQTTVRAPSALFAAIRDLAKKENRSLNAQIVTLLQEALAQRATPSAIPPVSPAS